MQVSDLEWAYDSTILNPKSAILPGGTYADLRFSLWRVPEEVHADHVHFSAGSQAHQMSEVRVQQGGAGLFIFLCQDITEELAIFRGTLEPPAPTASASTALVRQSDSGGQGADVLTLSGTNRNPLRGAFRDLAGFLRLNPIFIFGLFGACEENPPPPFPSPMVGGGLGWGSLILGTSPGFSSVVVKPVS